MRPLSSGLVILLVAGLVVALSAYLLVALSQTGLIAFTGGGWLVRSFNLLRDYLGYSILFFVPTFRSSLQGGPGSTTDTSGMESVRYYSVGMDVFITLFFAIGVLFTAWGLQNALVSALGGVSKMEASRLGAWGILRRLVDNGILIALWTTIVAGAGGYLMRLAKYLFLGSELNRVALSSRKEERTELVTLLESIKHHAAQIEQKLSEESP
jgi:hypothetical protein